LHDGGNLYCDISEGSCITLIKNKLIYLNYIQILLIAVPISDEGEPEDIIPRLNILKKDISNIVKSILKKIY